MDDELSPQTNDDATDLPTGTVLADEQPAAEADVAVEPDDAVVADDEIVDASFDLSEDAESAETDEDEEPEVPFDDPWIRPGSWYVVHTQSGYEKKVTANLYARIQ